MFESGQRRPLSFLMVLMLGVLTLAGLVIRDGGYKPLSQQGRLGDARLTEALMITDLALWTEARYTRHPSQADCFTPFQNAPAALDHFVSGTWIPPAVQQQDVGVDSDRHK